MLAARLRRPGTVAVFLVLALLVSLLVLLQGNRAKKISTTPVEPAAEYSQDAPNVVVVMTDDQAVDTMRAMPRTRHLIGRRGVKFRNAVVSFPLCCPSRATFLTGQYAHNHRVLDNHEPRGGYARLDSEHTLPVWLSRAGYETGFVGKFLNGYGKPKGNGDREVPPGWSEWYGLPSKGKQSAFDFQLNENGELVSYADDKREYKTEVLEDKAVSFVDNHAAGDRPFFLWVATNAPHRDGGLAKDAERNPEPAPRDRGRFDGKTPPKRDSVDERDVSDKPRFVRGQGRLDVRQREGIERLYVSQLESLVAVDRLVKGVVRELRDEGELDRTVLVFTSDNGFMRGEHRLDSGKSKLYEEAIRVPLLVRGPGFPEGKRAGRLVGNIDLAPTILDLAATKPDRDVDGTSMLPFDGGTPHDGRGVLLEIYERRHGRGVGLRTRRYAYMEYEEGERELYDLKRDPEQLESVHDDPPYEEVRARLAAEVERLRGCAGEACR